MCRLVFVPFAAALFAACSNPVPGTTTKDDAGPVLDETDTDTDSDSDTDTDTDTDADTDSETAHTGTPPTGSGG